MIRPRRWAGGSAIALALAITTSCGSTGEGKVDVDDQDKSPATSALSYDEALQRANGYSQETLTSVFGSGASLEPLEDDNPLTTYCSDVSDPPRGTPVKAQNDYRVAGADTAEVPLYFGTFEKHWSDAGWARRYGSADEGALAMGSDDGFVVQIQYASSNGLVSLTVNTPCVAPKDPDNPLGE